MGVAYRIFQHLAIESMEYFRDIGKEVEKEREKERLNKIYIEQRSSVDYEALDRHWDNLLLDCWDDSPPAFGKKSPRHSD